MTSSERDPAIAGADSAETAVSENNASSRKKWFIMLGAFGPLVLVAGVSIMAYVLSWPMDTVPVQSTLSSFWKLPSPRSPLAFWALEQQVQTTAGPVADQLPGHLLMQVHQAADVVWQAVAQARERSPVLLL